MADFKALTVPRVTGIIDPSDKAQLRQFVNDVTTFTQAVGVILNSLIYNEQITRTSQDTYEVAASGGTVDVADGGTGRNTLTDHALLVGSGTSPVDFVGPGAVGAVLQGAGSSADPAFTPTPTLGIAGTTLGSIALSGNTSGAVTIKPQAAAGTYNFNIPTLPGSSGEVLTSGGGGATPMTWTSASAFKDPKTSIYPEFTPAGVDDEFDDGAFTGWTTINDGSAVATVTETNNICSIFLPGGDVSGHIQAWMKTATVNANDIIEMAFRGYGRLQSANMCGLVFADGTTYNSGKQVLWLLSQSEVGLDWLSQTGYNTITGGATFGISAYEPISDVFLRLKYEGSNNWRGYASCDGISWVDISGSFSVTMTPTAVGFFASTFGGSLAHNYGVRYFRKRT